MPELSNGVITSLVSDLKDLTEDEIEDTLDNMVQMSVIYEAEKEEVLKFIQEEKEKAIDVLEEGDIETEELSEGVTETEDVIKDVEDYVDEGTALGPKITEVSSQRKSLAADSRVRTGKVVKKPDGYYVESEKGKNLGGPYTTREKAEDRLKEVEMFKHMSIDLQPNAFEVSLSDGTVDEAVLDSIIESVGHLPTPDKFKYVPKGVVRLYHGALKEMLPVIESEGIRPMSVHGGQYAEELVWLSSTPEIAWDHANKKAKSVGGTPVVLEVDVDTSVIGLHKALIKDFFITHEVIPYSMVTNVRTGNKKANEDVLDYNGFPMSEGDIVICVDDSEEDNPVEGVIKEINIYGQHLRQTETDPEEFPDIEVVVDWEDGDINRDNSPERLVIVG